MIKKDYNNNEDKGNTYSTYVHKILSRFESVSLRGDTRHDDNNDPNDNN